MPRSQPKASLQDRQMSEAMRLKDEANKLPPGPRQAVTARVHEWLSSPGLQVPQ